MENKRPPPPSSWADAEPIEALQRAAYAMLVATESFRRQLQPRPRGGQRPATYHASSPSLEFLASPLQRLSGDSSRDAGLSSTESGVISAGATHGSLDIHGVQQPSSDRPDTGCSSQVGSSSLRPPPSSHPSTSPDVLSGRSALPGRETHELFGAHTAAILDSISRSPSTDAISNALTDWPAPTGSGQSLTPTLVPDLQWSRQPYKTSVLRNGFTEVSDTPRAAAYRHSSYKPGQRLGLAEASSLDPLKVTSSVEISQPAEVNNNAPSLTHKPRQASAPPGSSDDKPTRPEGFSAVQEVLFVLMICLSQMLMLAGLAQAMVPAQIIGESFPDSSRGMMAWYSAAYGLTSATFVLPSGRVGDLFGHKKIFIIGFLWLAFWSVLAGFAREVQGSGLHGNIYFCFCRAMQGIGPALQVPNGQALLGRTYTPGMRKNMVLCLFGASAPVGFVLGGIMASLFAVRGLWPWAFWTLGALCVALATISIVVLPPPDKKTAHQRRQQQATGQLWTHLDGYGMVLGVSGLVLFNFAFNQAPIVSWTTPYTYFILIIGTMLIAAFVRHECRSSTQYPLVPITAMKSATNFVLGCTGAGWGCFGIWVYYTFSFLQLSRGWSPLLASISFVHGPVSGLAASVLVGVLITRVKPHWIMLISMASFFIGSLLLATAPVDQSYWFNTFFGILVMPFGMDMSNPAATIMLSNSVSKEHQGIAASLVVTTVNYSISLALGIAGTIEMNSNKGGQDLLAGHRAAQYFGTGLGFLGVLLALGFLLVQSCSRSPPQLPKSETRQDVGTDAS